MKIIKSNYWKEGSATTAAAWGADVIFYKAAGGDIFYGLEKDPVDFCDLKTVIVVTKDNIDSVIEQGGWTDQSNNIKGNLEISKPKKDEFIVYIELTRSCRAILIANKFDTKRMLDCLEKNKAGKSKRTKLTPEGFILGLIIVGIFYYFLSPDGNPSVPAETAPTKELDEFDRIWIGKEAIISRLKDPDSAEFRNVYLNYGINNIPVTCGEVNSKNSFGGYTGFQQFISTGIPEVSFLQSEAADFHIAWDKMCKK